MPKPKKVNVVFVLDQTSSMEPNRDATISGFNEYVAGLAATEPGAELALILFNTANVDFKPALPIKEVPKLDRDTYRPFASTPLYDAIGKAIADAEKRLKKKDKVIFVIDTDGEENSSVAFTREAIKAKIEERTGSGWAFVFLGANIDAYQTGGGLGVPQSNIVTYAVKSSDSVLDTAALESTRHYFRTGQTANLVSNNSRALVGDKVRIDSEDDS